LERETRLYHHAVTSRCVLGPWLITSGKNGGGEQNVCGHEQSLKTWKFGKDDARVINLGQPVVGVWSVVALEGSEKIGVVLMKKGRLTLEFWGIFSTIS